LSLVGIIANPESGRDIRRLVAHGSVVTNQEKIYILRRVLLGLAAAGVERVCYMPDRSGIVDSALADIAIPVHVFPLDMRLDGGQNDSTLAGRLMEELEADCVVTLGGDGTNRAAVKGSVRAPILPISTGTNNAFPYMIEGTMAGVAAGLVATGQIPVDEAAFRSTLLEIVEDGARVDLALVDAVVYDDLFVGSRAIWEMDKVRQIFLNRADPASIGISSIGGLMESVGPEEPRGLWLELGEGGVPVKAIVAPGVIETVSVRKRKTLPLDSEVEISYRPSVLALDGEREIEILPDQRLRVRLASNGPLVIDARRAMRFAMTNKLLTRG